MTPEASPTKNVQFVRGNNGRHTSHPPTSDFNYDIYDVPASPAAGQNPSRPSTRARKPGPRAGEKRRLPVRSPAVKNTAKPSRPIAAMRKSGRLGKANRVSYEEEESDDDIRKEKGDDPMGSRQHQVHLLLRVRTQSYFGLLDLGEIQSVVVSGNFLRWKYLRRTLFLELRRASLFGFWCFRCFQGID